MLLDQTCACTATAPRRADNDNLGEIRFEGKNSNNEVIVYARIHSEAAVVTDGPGSRPADLQLPLTVGSVGA